MQSGSRSRMLPLGAAAAVVLAVGLLATSASSANAATPRCATAQLRLKFVDGQGATGHRYVDYAFKNVGTIKCTLRGYPSGALLNKQGRVIKSARAKVGQWTISKVKTVLITPGQRAFFTFTWDDGAFCPGHSFTFYGLRVWPPTNATGFQRQLGKTPACNGSAKVSAVRAKLSI